MKLTEHLGVLLLSWRVAFKLISLVAEFTQFGVEPVHAALVPHLHTPSFSSQKFASAPVQDLEVTEHYKKIYVIDYSPSQNSAKFLLIYKCLNNYCLSVSFLTLHVSVVPPLTRAAFFAPRHCGVVVPAEHAFLYYHTHKFLLHTYCTTTSQYNRNLLHT